MLQKKIIFCLPGKEFSGNFLTAWTVLFSECMKRGIDSYFANRYTSNVYYVRSMCLGADVRRGKYQKPFDGKIDYDYIMWIDSDVIFTPNDFFKLLSHDKDIVSGLYPMENSVQFPTVENWDENYFEKYGTFKFLTLNDIKSKKDLFQVSYNGFGFMLIKKGVFEKIPYPWFAPKMMNIGKCEDFPSEDVSFCLRAAEYGFKIWVDPTVILKHEKSIQLEIENVAELLP